MGIILICYLQHRDFHLAFSNFLFSTFGSILIIPFVLKLFFGQTAPIEIRPILIQTAVLVIIPFIASRLVNRFGKKTLQQLIIKMAELLVPFFVFVIVSTTIAITSNELKWNSMLLSLSACVFAIYFLQGGLGYLAGYLIRKRDIKNTLALICSSRNCQIILAVAILNFSPLAAVPIIIATIFHHLMNAFWLWVLQRN
jgi:predicted Na+-dependent transporter